MEIDIFMTHLPYSHEACRTAIPDALKHHQAFVLFAAIHNFESIKFTFKLTLNSPDFLPHSCTAFSAHREQFACKCTLLESAVSASVALEQVVAVVKMFVVAAVVVVDQGSSGSSDNSLPGVAFVVEVAEVGKNQLVDSMAEEPELASEQTADHHSFAVDILDHLSSAVAVDRLHRTTDA